MRKANFEVLHDKDVGDLAGVITENKATHGRQQGEHDGKEADRKAMDVETSIAPIMSSVMLTEGHCESC